LNVHVSILPGNIRIIDHHTLMQTEGSFYKAPFFVTRIEQIETYTHVRAEEAAFIKAALAACRNTDKDYHFHFTKIDINKKARVLYPGSVVFA
jgi:hypothetical protein